MQWSLYFHVYLKRHHSFLQVVAIKKLDKSASAHLSDREFLDLVSSVSKLRHANIVELVGYCLEHGQRLLVYKYCRSGTFDEALNTDDEINRKLSWNARMRLALQAAKALEYVIRNYSICYIMIWRFISVFCQDICMRCVTHLLCTGTSSRVTCFWKMISPFGFLIVVWLLCFRAVLWLR